MFEPEIQEAWVKYKDDFGLARLVLVVCFFNTFLFFLSGFGYGTFYYPCLIPIGVSFLFFSIRKYIIQSSPEIKFLFNTVLLTFTVGFNYVLMGELDHVAGGLVLQDEFFLNFDMYLFGRPVALYFEDFFRPLGVIGYIFYDILILCYMSYFILPMYGGILFFQQLSDDYKYRMGRYFSSFIIYFCFNFFCYIWIPVTGPQFFIRDQYSQSLPLSDFGHFFYKIIQQGQTTFIDCFPSGHFGVTIMVTIWLFRINHGHRFIMLLITFLMGLAAMALRFHYTLDLVASIPLALICYKLGFVLFPVTVHPSSQRENQ